MLLVRKGINTLWPFHAKPGKSGLLVLLMTPNNEALYFGIRKNKHQWKLNINLAHQPIWSNIGEYYKVYSCENVIKNSKFENLKLKIIMNIRFKFFVLNTLISFRHTKPRIKKLVIQCLLMKIQE